VPDNRERYQTALDWSYLVGGKSQDKVFFQHTKTEHFSILREEDGARRYALKYAEKTTQKTVPDRYRNVGRFWGANRRVLESIPKPDFIKIDEGGLREYLYQNNNPVAAWVNLPMIIFHRADVSRETIGQKPTKG
jgi:hypothetical protein